MKTKKKFDLRKFPISASNSDLKTMYDALNHGQQKQIVKDEAVKELFDRYGVKY